jgi:O-antigen/teichoic acid export membrane protein
LIVKVFSSLLISYQQIFVDNLIKTALLFIRTGLVVVFVIQGFGVVSLGIGALISSIVMGLLAAWRTFRLLPSLKLRFRYVSWHSLKSLLVLGIWFCLKSLAHLGITSSSNIITGKILSVAMITNLSLTGRLYFIARKMLFQISRALQPALGQMIGEGKRDPSFIAFRQNLILSSGLASLIIGCILSINRDFVTWWVGVDYYADGITDLLMGIHFFVFFWNAHCMTILSSDKQLVEQTLVRLVQFVFGISASIFLGRLFGLAGIIGGMLVAGVSTSFWFLPVVACRKFNYSVRRFITGDLVRVVTFTLLVISLSWQMRGVESIGTSIVAILVKGGITGLTGMLLAWFVLLDQYLREDFIRYFKVIFHKLKYSGESVS